MKKIIILLSILLLPALLVAQANQAVQTRSIVFEHVTIINVTGKPSMSDMTVIIVGNRIAASW